MEVQGIVKAIGATQQVNASFSKRELVVTTDEQYPQHILIEFAQDKCALLDGLKVGEKVVIGINLRGREWTNPQGETKYFNSIQGWRVDKSSKEPANNAPAKKPQFEAPQTANDDNDLPF